jgi:small acid-soluble spore protein P (minor)
MSKPRAYAAGDSLQSNEQDNNDQNNAPQALSGSKKVKNRNHSRQNQAKGS